VSIVNVLLRPDRVDLVTDTLATSSPAMRPCALAGKVSAIPTGRGLALVAAVGSNTVLPAVLHVLSGMYLRDIGDAVAPAARQLAAVVAAETARYGSLAGRGGCVMLVGPSAEGGMCAWRLRTEAARPGEVDAERLEPGPAAEPNIFSDLHTMRGVEDMVRAALEQVRWLKDEGLSGGGPLLHYALANNRCIIRTLDTALPDTAAVLASMEAARVAATS
jgi:hypothetical protein